MISLVTPRYKVPDGLAITTGTMTEDLGRAEFQAHTTALLSDLFASGEITTLADAYGLTEELKPKAVTTCSKKTLVALTDLMRTISDAQTASVGAP